MEQQRREVRAYQHQLLHNYVLRENSKINAVTRSDHRAMIKILLSEAFWEDREKATNLPKWERILRDLMKEVDSKNSIMSIAPDPYQGCVAKLSSMMMWNESGRYWQYRYWEEELNRRRSVQARTLMALRAKGGLFLN